MRRLSLAVLAALVLAAAASADDVVVPLTVRPGSLSLAPATVLARGARIAVTVTDARGRGAGWTLLARASVPGSPTVVVTGVDAHCGVQSTCTLPRNGVRFPVMLSSFRAVPVVVAARGTGMGTIQLTLRFGTRPSLGGLVRFSVQPR